jgi:glycosyltransferase involved in cell wall biosynthesis
MYSVVLPVYRNAESLPELVRALAEVDRIIRERFAIPLEAVFVVDGSPDESYELLEHLLPAAPFSSKLVLHARNFGSFAAIRTGLKTATGPYFSMVAADLQEPPELLISFLANLVTNENDIVVGTRIARDDPLASRVFADLFWRFYRVVVMPEVPVGGVDLFGCNQEVRNELLRLEEANSSLVGLVFWLGFRRKEISYERRARKYGKSAWTFRKKFKYLVDSIFAFTDLPIRLLTFFGAVGVAISAIFGLIVLAARLLGEINVPGYAAIVLTVIFFGALNMMGIGIIGAYVWRSYENSKCRPLAVVRQFRSFAGSEQAADGQEFRKQVR